MISNEQLNKLKAELLDRKKQLSEQVGDTNQRLEQINESVGELSSYDNHPADMATELFERQKDITLSNRAREELDETNDALARINNGTYGTCTVCGKDIPFARLEAIPTTDRCIDHVQYHPVVDDKRPPEEDVYSHDLNSKDDPLDESVIYDQEDAWQDVARYGTSETPADFIGDKDNYNEMYPNSDDLLGNVESVEAVATANITGHYDGISINFHNRLDEDLIVSELEE